MWLVIKGKFWIIALIMVLIYLLGFTAGRASGASTRSQAINQLNAECSQPYASNGFLSPHCKALIYGAASQGFKPSHATADPSGRVNWN